MKVRKCAAPFLALLLLAGCGPAESGYQILFDPGDAEARQVISLSGDQIVFTDGRLSIEFQDHENSSTLEFSPESGTWDASDYRFIRCELENLGAESQLVELGFGGYDLTLGATIIPPGSVKTLKAVIYRAEHPEYIDEVFPVMHGKPDGVLRGWMASTSDSIVSIKLLFPELKPGASVRIGKIWMEEPYVLYSKEELQEKFYPFVDSFGQLIFNEWPNKIHSAEELKAHQAMETKELDEMEPLIDRNRYGGWESGPQLEATGRFRVEKVDGTWWFVDPEGKLFWSQGIDCVEFGTQSRTRISGREHYFRYLPGEEGPEGRLYSRAPWRGGDTLQWLSFHALNLYRLYGPEWKEVSVNRIHNRFRSWGMNTIGNWSDKEIYLKRRTPYVLTANSRKTGLIADPFAEGFREDLEHWLESRQEELGDPWCLGVFIDNELKWGVKWGPKIPEQLLVSPADQPAKLKLRDVLEEKYESVEELNESWGTSFRDWTDFLRNGDPVPKAQKDMKDFMKLFTARYYESCRDAVKAVDPDMLYLGCRMDFHLYPEDTSLNYIMKIAAEYCDVVSFNRYRYTCSGLVPPDNGDYPIIIGEFHFGSLETGLLQPGLRYAADPEERAMFYEHYVSSALKNPFIVGTHWFQLVDQAVTGRPDGENYQAGFLTVGDVPQQEIIRVSREMGRKMYHIRSTDN